MPYPNDRRKHAADPDEELSPEFLAMLVACGGEVRAEDRSTLSEGSAGMQRRRRADDEGQTPPVPGDRQR